SAPAAPSGLTGSATESTVTLSWVAPSGGDAPTSYMVEAGSTTGRSDLANFDTVNGAVTLTVDAVPVGTYFLRVRSKNAAGVSAASNEITVVVVVPPSSCTSLPSTPTSLAARVTGTSV